jgi:acyl dehydratase
MADSTAPSLCLDSAEAALAAVGQELGVTDWITITQERINTFAEATGDHQWIHIDPVRAKEGPFGACIAHGFLTLSLANLFLPQLVRYEHLKMGVNYGCDKVRFPSPVLVNSRVRGRGQVFTAELIKDNGVQVVVIISVEIEGASKPGCVVNTISRLYFE